MKVLVMGNGCSIFDYEYGKIIDNNFDIIFRINRFKTEGFEKHVGSKTDAWITVDYGVDWIMNQYEKCPAANPKILDTISKVYFFIPFFKYEPESDRITSLGYNQGKYQVIPKSIEEQINSKIDFKPAWPLTGTISLQMVANNYDDIYIHGFDMFDTSYEYYHYYDKGKDNRKTEHFLNNAREHDVSKDKQMMELLIKEHNIKVLSKHVGDFDSE